MVEGYEASLPRYVDTRPVTAGLIGLDEAGDPRLYLVNPLSNGARFKDDGRLEFAGESEKTESVSLLSTTPRLTFHRKTE